MKKLVLTTFVILSFGLYSFHSRYGDSAAVQKPSLPGNASQTARAPSGNASNNSAAPTAYKDGRYTGSTADAYYGYIQVLAVISSGKLIDVQFLQYPNDNPNSSYISSQSKPYLKQEAVQVQSANVNIVSGATLTSQAFIQSLSDALNKARS